MADMTIAEIKGAVETLVTALKTDRPRHEAAYVGNHYYPMWDSGDNPGDVLGLVKNGVSAAYQHGIRRLGQEVFDAHGGRHGVDRVRKSMFVGSAEGTKRNILADAWFWKVDLRGRPESADVTHHSGKPVTADEIDGALDAMLRETIKHRELKAEAAEKLPFDERYKLHWFGSEPIKTRRQYEAINLVEDPIGYALRHAIKRLGVELYERAGNVSLMVDAIDRVADMNGARSGYRGAIMDSAWNAIGREPGGHWWS